MKLTLLLVLAFSLFAESTAPSGEELNALAIKLIDAQAARINMLEKLAEHQAGTEDIKGAENAAHAFTELLKSTAQKHNACEGAFPNFAKKEWACPNAQPPSK